MTAAVLAAEPAPLLRVEDVARRLSLSTRAVRELVQTGALIAYRPSPTGRSLRIDPASVEAHLCRQRVAVPQPVPAATNAARTSANDQGDRPGTRAGASSATNPSPSTPPTPPRQSGDSARSSASARPADVLARLALRRQRRRSTSP